MVSEARKQSMAWMETDYSKHTYFRWEVKWRLEHLGALGIMGESAPLRLIHTYDASASYTLVLAFVLALPRFTGTFTCAYAYACTYAYACVVRVNQPLGCLTDTSKLECIHCCKYITS